jgi:tetratricopeptide (TPR) repeat protein
MNAGKQRAMAERQALDSAAFICGRARSVGIKQRMKNYQRCCLLLAVLAGLCAVSFRGRTQTVEPARKIAGTELAAREDAYRANNLGVALLEQYKYREGADAFARALRLDPGLRLARVNLSIALYNVPDLAGAEREAKAALALAPDLPQPHYIVGLISKTQNRMDDALAAFERVLDIDPRDVGANVNKGQLLAQQRKHAEAIAAFRAALASEPYNMTALYNLGLALTRTGNRAEGQQMLARFQGFQRSGAGTSIGTNYLEQGRYAEAVASTGAEPELVDRSGATVTFTDATESTLPKTNGNRTHDSATPRAGITSLGKNALNGQREIEMRDLAKLGGGALLFDYDADGDLDLLDVAPAALRLLRNDGGKFTDVTPGSGLPGMMEGVGLGAVAGDYDNDGNADLLVLRYDTGCLLYHNDGGGRFSDVTRAANIPGPPQSLSMAVSAAFVDVDHDGDLDIFMTGASNLLLRNNGDGKFADVTAAAQVLAHTSSAAVVPTDFDNRRDVDLLVLPYHDAPVLFRNLRDTTFRNVAAEVGLSRKSDYTCVAAGDYNKDTYTDFFLGRRNETGLFALSDGRGGFTLHEAPNGTTSARAAQFLDYDADGLLDLVLVTGAGLRVWRNVGNDWMDVSEQSVARHLLSFNATRDSNALRAVVASGDIDNDGDVDLILRTPEDGLRVARNDGGNGNQSLRVQLSGRVSNRSAVGAKIEVRSGSLVQKLETYSASPAPAPADLVFGLGRRTSVDAVRVLWPAGIVQAETEIPSAAVASGTGQSTRSARALLLPIKELDRKPSSCPFLYTWNGERFEFITDFMGGGEMGYWEGPHGHYNTPDADEYVRIRGEQLKERDGRYELRVTNELEEVLYVDRLQLVAIAHPRGAEVYPNEGMVDAPLPPFKLYATRAARPPLAATDDHGHDVLARVSHLDRQYPDDFTLDQIRGYSAEHALTLKLDNEGAATGRTLLLLTGWTDYAFSSDNVAASHAGKSLRTPALQVRDARGRWRTVIDNIGIPIGRPQTVTLDLTGKFPTRNREVRILTNMRIYWDRILVDTSSGIVPLQMTRLDALRADLRWRGYSAEVSPDNREPFTYDYERVSPVSPWKVAPGRYTREGDVRELLLKRDDQFVISRTGDELSLSFDARSLPALPAGWTRTFLLYADGFSKEMDINSASPDMVGPLPFHGMTRYPYEAPEAYRLTPARRVYIERYNTRTVAAPIPTLVSGFRF